MSSALLCWVREICTQLWGKWEARVLNDFPSKGAGRPSLSPVSWDAWELHLWRLSSILFGESSSAAFIQTGLSSAVCPQHLPCIWLVLTTFSGCREGLTSVALCWVGGRRPSDLFFCKEECPRLCCAACGAVSSPPLSSESVLSCFCQLLGSKSEGRPQRRLSQEASSLNDCIRTPVFNFSEEGCSSLAAFICRLGCLTSALLCTVALGAWWGVVPKLFLCAEASVHGSGSLRN